MKYFVDTSFIIALESLNDINHNDSIKIWENVNIVNNHFLISNFIIDEILTFFNTKGFHQKAIEIYESIFNSSKFEIIYIDKIIFDKSFLFIKKNKDKKYSFTDCTSFIIMNSFKIHNVLSFDNHFSQAGFNIIAY